MITNILIKRESAENDLSWPRQIVKLYTGNMPNGWRVCDNSHNYLKPIVSFLFFTGNRLEKYNNIKKR